MNSLMSVLSGLWTHVGPGLLLILSLPLFLVLVGMIVWARWDRRSESSTQTE